MMALPRKGSRKIIVDGLPYRWYIRPRPTNTSQDYGDVNITIAIEREDVSQRTRLIVDVPLVRPDGFSTKGKSRGYVTPADVAKIIQSALADGWLADQQGSPWTYTMKNVGTKID
jgi:hypothetical protein